MHSTSIIVEANINFRNKKYNEAIAELRKKNNPNITNEEYKTTYDEKQKKFKAYNEKYTEAIGNIDTDTFTDSVANVFNEPAPTASGGGKTLRKRTLRRQSKSKSKSKTHKKNKRRRVHPKTTHKRLHNASLKKRRLRHRQRQRHRQEKKYTRRR
jgi:hypothetical protein